MSKRGPGYIKNALTLTDAYKDYKEMSEGKGLFDQPEKVYKAVNKRFNELLMIEYLVKDARIFYLPHMVGVLSIEKKKIKVPKDGKANLRIDWEQTKKLGKRIYHLNSHTNGYNYRFLWRRRGVDARVKNITKYSFIPTRTHKRALAAFLKDSESGVDSFSIQ